MLNSYYAQMFSGERQYDQPICYGYTFRDKNMREAKLHVVELCKQLGFNVCASVWRISHAEHVRLYSPYTIPTPIMNEPYEEK